MRHVLLVALGLLAVLLLGCWQNAYAKGERPVTTTYYKQGKPFATVTRYPSGALVVESAKYEIHNNTHTGPTGTRLVINKEKQTAKTHQTDRQGHAIDRPAKPIAPIEVWKLPGK